MEHYKNTYIPILINEIFKPVFNETQIEIIREYFKAQAEAEIAQAEADAAQAEAGQSEEDAAQAEAGQSEEDAAQADAGQSEEDAAQAVAAQEELKKAQKEQKKAQEELKKALATDLESNQILKSIFDVENNFLEYFFDKDNKDNKDNKYDFGITRMLKGEIFDITATSKNNDLGKLKSEPEHFKNETSLQDLTRELYIIKSENEKNDKSEKRELRLNFINDCIELDKGYPDEPFNKLFKFLTAYINGFNTIGKSNEQFIVKNSGGNIFKLYAELLYLIFQNGINEIEEDFINMVSNEKEVPADTASGPAPNLFEQIQNIMINMFRESSTLHQRNIYNSLRDNIISIRLQNYSDIDSYIIQNSVAGAGAEGPMETGGAPAEGGAGEGPGEGAEGATGAAGAEGATGAAGAAPEEQMEVEEKYEEDFEEDEDAAAARAAEEEARAENPGMVLLYDTLTNKLDNNFTDKNNEIYLYLKTFNFKTFKEIELLHSDINTIDKISYNINIIQLNPDIQILKQISDIQILKQISDTLDDGIKNIQNIQGTPRQKKARIKSNFNNTLKEINSIIDNYNKIVRKQVKEAQAQAQEQEQAQAQANKDKGFILFRIKSYNKIIGFNPEDKKINYNIKELLIKLELINELNKEIVQNIKNSEYNYLPSYNNLHTKVQGILPSPLYPQVFQNNFLEINNTSSSGEKKILGHLFLKSLQYEKELMRISTDTNSRKLLQSNNFNNNIKNLHKIFEAINTSINLPVPAVPPEPDDFSTLSSLLKSNSLIDAMIKALIAFNIKTKDSEINYNEQYNNNASEIDGKMAKTLLGQTGHDIKDAYNIMITNIHNNNNITPKYLEDNFKNQLLNFIAIETSDKTEI